MTGEVPSQDTPFEFQQSTLRDLRGRCETLLADNSQPRRLAQIISHDLSVWENASVEILAGNPRSPASGCFDFEFGSSNAFFDGSRSKKPGVAPGIIRFIIPLGATINMDGTVLYQVAAGGF
jgi:Sodium:dicarboxylate symporter family